MASLPLTHPRAPLRAPFRTEGMRRTGRFVILDLILLGLIWAGVETNSLKLVFGGTVVLIALTLTVLRPHRALLVFVAGWGALHAAIVDLALGGGLTLSQVVGIAVTIGFGTAAIQLRAESEDRRISPPLAAASLFLVVYLGALAHAVDRSGGISDFVKLAAGVALAAVAYFTINSRSRLLTLSTAAVFSGVVVSIATTMQFVLLQTAPGLGQAIFGANTYLYSANATSTLHVVRVAGAFGGADATAGYLFISVAFGLLRFTLNRDRTRSRGDAIAIAVVSVGIFATLTRAATAAVIILLIVWAILWQVRSVTAARVRIRLILVFVVGAILAVLLLGQATIGARLWDINPSSGGSFAQGRGAIWQQELDTLRNSDPVQLLIGHGAHASYVSTVSAGGDIILWQPHNLFLWLLVDTGLIGFAVYLAFLVGLGRRYLTAAREWRFTVRGRIGALGFATFVAFMVHSFFALAPITVGMGWYFMLFVGATLRAAEPSTSFDEEEEEAEEPEEAAEERALVQPLLVAAAVQAPLVLRPAYARPLVHERPIAPAWDPPPDRPRLAVVDSAAEIPYESVAEPEKAVAGMWRRAARDASILVSSALVMVLLQVAFRLQAIHELSAANYGRLALLVGIFVAATVIGQYGIPVTAARLGARTRGRQRDRELLASLTKAAVLPTLVASVLMGAATYWVTHSLFLAVVGFAGTAPLVTGGICSGFVRGKGMVWQSALILPANLIAQIVALALVVAAGVDVGVGWVLACFTIGNVAALAAGVFVAWRALKRAPAVNDEPDVEATPRRIVGYSMWLSLSTLAVLGLGLVPRVALAHISYKQVALFDVALLIYTVPQRLRGSFLQAIVPLAAIEQKRHGRIAVPGRLDLTLVTAVVVLVDGVLWMTHGLRHLLEIAGMSQYAGAEPLLLIILFGIPAELFFSLNSGLLQAFGESRRLAFRTGGVLVLSVIAAPLTVVLGPKYLAAVLVADFWALYLLTRRLLAGHGIIEEPMLNTFLAGRLRLRRTG